MTLPLVATVQRGETFSWALAARPDPAGATLPGDLATATARSALKAITATATTVPPHTDPEVASATGTWNADLGDGVAGWLFTLSPATTAALAAGRYCLDVRITRVGGAVTISEPAAVMLVDRVTAP